MALVVKNPPANAGDARDVGSAFQSGRSPGEGNGNPLQYSCLENAVDGGAWRATVHRVTKTKNKIVLFELLGKQGGPEPSSPLITVKTKQ